jgi:putative membrane-bound dehydrogenase-like protein
VYKAFVTINVRWLVACLTTTALVFAASGELPPGVANTQKPGDAPPTPEEARKHITVPEGFKVTLFAGEPDVAQPIAINYDDRGRLWVAESFSYIEWQRKAQDHISIFEDADNDGRFDSKKVFWSKANHLSGFQIGFGGVWVCDAPQLLFIPDKNRDDIPDGPPVVMLDGWATNAEHNFLNGLTWGLDGWLWGRHGIKKPSRVGKPGTPDKDRVELSCAIWRFHPTRHVFEVIADGTVNPWGLDWNEDGQPFITTSVVDHLWHVVPGARFQRREGKDEHPHPYTYELMKPISDHRHWDDGPDAKERHAHAHPEQGGGHAHSGLMIYQADVWPEKYRGKAFFSNIHGNRINMDSIERRHSSYVAKHGPDFLLGNSPWFRAVDLKQTPDGNMMIAEWTDLGECHDRDGVHRTSGRLFKVSYGESKPMEKFDLQEVTDEALAGLLLQENGWRRRTALRILHERRMRKENHAFELIQRLIVDHADRVTAELAHASAGHFPDDTPMREKAAFLREALFESQEPSDRLNAAAALQFLPVEHRWQVAQILVDRSVHPDDRNLALMIWYAIEPLIAEDPKRALKLAADSKIPLIRQYIARRVVDLNKAK